jgi:hypothetical protein
MAFFIAAENSTVIVFGVFGGFCVVAVGLGSKGVW